MLFVSRNPKQLIISNGVPYKFHSSQCEVEGEDADNLMKAFESFKKRNEVPPFEPVLNTGEVKKQTKKEIKEIAL